MPKGNDITGQRFGRLTVLSHAGTTKEKPGNVKRRVALWKCRCNCGSEITVIGANLRNGTTKSCGCLERDILYERNFKHGLTDTRENRIWRGMLTRCRNLNHKDFKYYGGRGIRVCERWEVFENFLADMGPCPEGYSIERVDNNRNYEPSNCKWIPQEDQAKNMRKRQPKR